MAKRRGQGWVPKVVTPSGVLVCVGPNSLKYLASRSTWRTPGLAISPRAIFSRVLKGTPLPSDTDGHEPLVDCRAESTNSKMESDMTDHANPRYGVTQPGNGFCGRLTYVAMGRPTKETPRVQTPADIIGAIIADNVVDLLGKCFPGRTQTDQIEALARRSGVSKETIRRIIKRDVSPRVDNLHQIATALSTTAAALLQSQRSSPAKESHLARIST